MGELTQEEYKRQLIKEMAREIYINSRNVELRNDYCPVLDAVNYAQYFYDNIEQELDRVLKE